MTESAIPPHLRREARCPRRMPTNYTPPYPAYSARPATGVRAVAMAYLGVQSTGEPTATAVQRLSSELESEYGPQYWEPTRYVDPRGCTNWVAVAYWDDTARYQRWLRRPAWTQWWESADRSRDDCGYFLEALTPRIEDFETLYSSARHVEGIGRLCPHMSGEVLEHAYWGSARERIPAAQTEELAAVGEVHADRKAENGRVRVQLHDGVCLIRSGQDWSETQGRERELYLDTMEPVLRKGMDFLRDSPPADTGCHSCRYMTVLDKSGAALEKRFGLAWFRSLGDLERWSEFHPTHLAIFGTFMKIVEELQGQLAAHFWHEVTVARGEDVTAEYINCHSDTGLLRAAPAR
jgi:aliphatic aldoxime dehydratase